MEYQSGFGNVHSTEAVPGALPGGKNAPQQPPNGLYAEVISGTAFTAPRAENLSAWLYRLRPSAMHATFRRIDDRAIRSGPFDEVETPPNRLRWNPLPIPSAPADFLDELITLADSDAKCEVINKFMGALWAAEWSRSPLDVVAWHGRYAPYKYDLARFMTINTVSFDHADPSIFTVLTSPSGQPGVANVDFVIFPPRWQVAEHTFRPPWFHRNVMSELMGLVHGVYDAKASGFLPGGVSIHNCMAAHGPDRATFDKASAAELKPQKIENTLAFMWESRWVWRPTRLALSAPELQKDYDKVWDGFKKGTDPIFRK